MLYARKRILLLAATYTTFLKRQTQVIIMQEGNEL